MHPEFLRVLLPFYSTAFATEHQHTNGGWTHYYHRHSAISLHSLRGLLWTQHTPKQNYAPTRKQNTKLALWSKSRQFPSQKVSAFWRPGQEGAIRYIYMWSIYLLTVCTPSTRLLHAPGRKRATRPYYHAYINPPSPSPRKKAQP